MYLKLSPVISIILLFMFNSCGNTSSNSTTEPDNKNIPQAEPYYPYAWHLDTDKSALTAEGYDIEDEADIHIQEAWSITQGDQVKVAVIDNGFDIAHEDLASNVMVAFNIDANSSDVSDESDGITHGSACASFIVAPINGKGIVGVAPQAKLIAIKQWNNSDAEVIRGFEYAKNQGAKVISCSWGTGQVSPAVEAELKSLYDAGITVVFAVGNHNIDMDSEEYHDESEVPWVIGVGATLENNDVANYSNYGSQLDVIAPGGNAFYSIGLLGIDKMGEEGSTNQNDIVNSNYTFMSGTSFSAPIVAGVIVLMYSVNPDITPKQVRDILIKTTEKVGGSDLYDKDGFNTYRAFGKVHADRAVHEAKNLL